MFNQIFTCPHTIERHLAAPCVEQRLSYLHDCAEHGASRATLRLVAANLLAINDYLNLGTEGDISSAQIEAAKVNEECLVEFCRDIVYEGDDTCQILDEFDTLFVQEIQRDEGVQWSHTVAP